MAAISATERRRLFTKKLQDTYREMIKPTGFLSSMFQLRTQTARDISYEVRRGFERVAEDVSRGTEGNRNTFGQFTEKVIQPPYFREYFDATDLSYYDQYFGQGDMEVEPAQMVDFIQEATEKIELMRDKIERKKELMASQVLQTGVVTLKNAQNIDFRRKGTSLVDLGTNNYWDDTDVNPITSIEAGCNVLRQVGKSPDGEFNMILGAKAFNSLVTNDEIRSRSDLKQVQLIELNLPQRMAPAVGAVLQGILAAGSYRVIVWTYPQFFDDKDNGNASTPYIGERKMILLPKVPQFRYYHGGLPQIVRDRANAEFAGFMRQVRGEYMIGNYIDEESERHVVDIKSAPVPVPVAVDQMYTADVTTA